MAGELTFNMAPDHEMPGSAVGSNIYTVIVTATDGQSSTPLEATQTFTITVTDANDNAPVFTSSTTADVAEGMTTVTTVTATDGCRCGTGGKFHADERSGYESVFPFFNR